MEKEPSSTPDKSTTLLNQAKAMAAQGNKVVAVALLSQYIACTPEKETEEAHRLRGDLLLQMGDKRGAEEDAEAVLRINPSLANGHFQLDSHLHLSVIIIFTLHGNAKREVACRFQLKTDNNP